MIPQEAEPSEEVVGESTQYNFAGDYTEWFYNGEFHNLVSD